MSLIHAEPKDLLVSNCMLIDFNHHKLNLNLFYLTQNYLHLIMQYISMKYSWPFTMQGVWDMTTMEPKICM